MIDPPPPSVLRWRGSTDDSQPRSAANEDVHQGRRGQRFNRDEVKPIAEGLVGRRAERLIIDALREKRFKGQIVINGSERVALDRPW